MSDADDELRSIRKTAHDWQVRINNFEISDAERAAFEKWINADPRHEDAYERASTISSAMGRLSRDDIDERFAEIGSEDRIFALSNVAIGGLNARLFQVAAAGAVLAAMSVVAIPTIFGGGDTPDAIEAVVSVTFVSAIGESREITLNEGTKVTLGAASEIAVSILSNARDVELLRGAAFFDVASDPTRPFTVTADRLTAKALGTQFDVRRSGGVTRVAVAEGRVEVGYPMLIDGEASDFVTRRPLSAGTQIAAIDGDGLQSTVSVNIGRVGEWRSDRLVYESASLAELVADANRYANARVEFTIGSEYVSAYKISGAFNGRDIDGMLNTLEAIHPVEIDRSEPDVIRIRAKTARAKDG
ncbi:MAG: FecR domain-containing protein [Pseudomonadota bacterium]